MTIKFEKLHQLLSNNTFTIEEVNFLFSEMRKLMEAKKINLSALKFYCDWVLHPAKDRITPEMKSAFQKMYTAITFEIDNPMRVGIKRDVNNFIYFDKLKIDFSTLLKKLSLSDQITQNEDIWVRFIERLVKLLEEQPINNPMPEIASFEYVSSGESVVIGRFTFVTPYKGYPYYQIMNHYGL